jgi:hypothetical protein
VSTQETLDRLLATLTHIYSWGAETSDLLERLQRQTVEAQDPDSVAAALRLSLTAAESARTAREKLASLRLLARRLRRAVSAGIPTKPEEEGRLSSTTQGERLELYTDPFGDILRSLLECIDDLSDALTAFVDHLRGEVLHRGTDDSAIRRAAAIERGQKLCGPVLACLSALRTVASGLRAYLGR